ncbi:MAG TPA: c-type cytochrome domain-containing protein [Planctomycetota bacterium]|nr:c-type cytochrome domain-containing protein [Planctomycetota bacterium]
MTPARALYVLAITFISAPGIRGQDPAAGGESGAPVAPTPAFTPTPIEEPALSGPVDFEKDVLPFLRKNCLACHNEAESRGDLVLETPATILEGGRKGAVVVPGKAAESPMLLLASLARKPMMPPPENKAGASPLTSRELGLLKLWIDEGARGTVTAREPPARWHPLPRGLNPIYAVALTKDGRLAACGRANQVFIHDLVTGQLRTRLTDPALLASGLYQRPGVADLDSIQSLAFHPEGELLASGGYRTVKLWRRPRGVKKLEISALDPATAGGPSTAAAVSPDGKLLARGTSGGSIQLAELASGNVALQLPGPAAQVTALRFSPDGSILAAAFADGSILLWTLPGGAPAGRIDPPGGASALAFLAAGKSLAAGGADGVIRIFETPRGPSLLLASGDGKTPAFAASPDGKRIALGAPDHRVLLVDPETGGVVAALAGHTAAISCISFSADGTRVASAGADGAVHVWDSAKGERVDGFRGPDGIERVLLTPDGGRVVAGLGGGRVLLWKLGAAATRTLAPVEGGSTGLPSAAALGGGGKRLAAARTVDGKTAILVRDLESGAAAHAIEGIDAAVVSLALDASGARLAAGLADGRILNWSLAPGAPAGDPRVSTGHGGSILAVAWAGDSEVISVSADGTLRAWSAPDGKEVRSSALPGPAAAAAIGQEGKLLALAGPEKDLKLFDLATGAPIGMAAAGAGTAEAMPSFSPDGSRLVATTPAGEAVVRDARTGGIIEVLPCTGAPALALFGSSAGEVLRLDASGSVRLDTLRFEREAGPAKGRITALRSSGDGATLFVAAEDGTLRGIRLEDAMEKLGATQAAPLHDIALSPDGQSLLGAGGDGQLRLWNVSDGVEKPIRQPAGGVGPVRAVSFSADGLKVLAASDGGVLVIDLASDATEELLREHAGPVTSLACLPLPGGRGLVISASVDGVRSRPLLALKALRGHAKAVTALAALPEGGAQLLSGSKDGTVRQWEAAAGSETRRVDHGAPVTAVAARPDGQAFASAGTNGVAKLWNVQDGKLTVELKGDPDARHGVARLALEESGASSHAAARRSAHAAAEKARVEAELKARQAAEALAAAEKKLAEENAAAKSAADAAAAAGAPADAAKKSAEAAKAAARAMTASNAAAAGVADAGLVLTRATSEVAERQTALDAAEAAQVRAKALLEAAQKALPPDRPIHAVAFSPGGLEAVTGGEDGAVRKWNVRNGAAIETHAGPADAVTFTSFPPGGGLVSVTRGGAAAVWDPSPDWTLERTLGSPDDPSVFTDRVTALAWSPDGSLLATGGGEPSRSGQLKVWRTADGSLALEVPSPHSDAICALEISNDGSRIASGGADRFLKVFDAATGKPLRSFEGHTHHVLGVSWRHNGQILVSSGGDGVVKVWDFETGEGRRTIGGFQKQVTAIRFLGVGPEIVTACGDRSVRVHQSENGQGVRTVGTGDDYMYALDVTYDGRIVAAGGQSGVLFVWETGTGTALHKFPPPPDEPAAAAPAR